MLTLKGGGCRRLLLQVKGEFFGVENLCIYGLMERRQRRQRRILSVFSA